MSFTPPEDELARCDIEIARCWNHECLPGDWLGAVMGWADYSVERMKILEVMELHGKG